MSRLSVFHTDAGRSRFAGRPTEITVLRQHCPVDTTLAQKPRSRSHVKCRTFARLGRFDLFTAPRPTYEVVGLGEAMVDYSGMVSESYLESRDVSLGGRRYGWDSCIHVGRCLIGHLTTTDWPPRSFQRLRDRACQNFQGDNCGRKRQNYSRVRSERFSGEVTCRLVHDGVRVSYTMQTQSSFSVILQTINWPLLQLNAGGSLANTLAGCAVLARAAHDLNPESIPESRIGMAGMIGDDHLGGFFQQQLLRSGVKWLGVPAPGSSTGTVLVLTTPDAQRSFLSLPSASGLSLCPAVAGGMASARMLVIEGYLWEMPDARHVIRQAIALARAAGSVVVMTAADVSVVRKHREAMLETARASDVFFTNAEEARELVGEGVEAKGAPTMHEDRQSIGYSRPKTAEADALQLGRVCPMSVVTDGSRGSCIAALGQLHVVPPHWAKEAPVDTCGAGDAYAAGFLHAYLRGLSVRQMGEFAAATASSVIAHHGPSLDYDDARALVASHTACSRLQSQSLAESW